MIRASDTPGKGRFRARLPRSLVVIGCLAVAGCAALGEPTPNLAFREAERAEAGRFDTDASLARLDEAVRAYQAEDDPDAEILFREATLLWPANVAAWQGLALAAENQNKPELREAALFIVERLAHYPTDALFVQREINGALRSYAAEQRASAEGEMLKAENAELLAAYLDDLYAQRGAYQAPDRPFFNISGLDYVAVILSGGGAGFYAYSLAQESASE